MTFHPSRFLATPWKSPQQDPYKLIFGFGRRVRPEARFAELSLFLNVASVLATFDIFKVVGDQGRET
jgi:hypothetical protein